MGIHEPALQRVRGKLSKSYPHHRFFGRALPRYDKDYQEFKRKYTKDLMMHVLSIDTSDHQVNIIRFPNDNYFGAEFALFPTLPIFDIKTPKEYDSCRNKAIAANCVYQKLNRLLPKIERFSERIHRCVKPNNRTPYLLPTRNFKDEVLINTMREIYITKEEQLHGDVPNFFNKLNQRIKVAKSKRSKRRSFIDKSGMQFSSSERSNHGAVWDEDNGEDTCRRLECEFFGRIRLGTTFAEGFHYDCTNSSSKACKGWFINCHGEEHFYSSSKNLNIFPNDRIRDESKRVTNVQKGA